MSRTLIDDGILIGYIPEFKLIGAVSVFINLHGLTTNIPYLQKEMTILIPLECSIKFG